MAIISVTNLYNSAIVAGGTSLAVTPTDAQVQGSNLVLCINRDLGVTISSITDTSGNKYTQVSPTIGLNDYSEDIWLASGIKAAAANANTVTVAFGASTTLASIACYLIAGSPLTATGSATSSGTGTAITTGNISTRVPASILVAMTGVNHTVNGSTAGWTASAVDALGDVTEYLIKTNALTTVNPNFTQTASGTWVASCVALAAPQELFLGQVA